jgi:hypothetical protein
VIDLIIYGICFAIFLPPLFIGYFGYGNPIQPRSWLKKTLISLAAVQLIVLIFFGRIFVNTTRHLNHVKWIGPLLFVYMIMWICLAVGYGVAAVRYRMKW